MKPKTHPPQQGILLSLAGVFLAPIVGAQTLQSLHSFGGTDGAEPVAALIQGSDGDFYGTTSHGGDNDMGTVFKLTPEGNLTVLVSFDGYNGATPRAALLQASDGDFYGTTSEGGDTDSGTVFRMTPAGSLTTLVVFDGENGADPESDLIQARDGNFYGTTGNGTGTVFRMLPDGTLTTLLSFDESNGGYPSGLVQGSDGYLYGTTWSGGDTDDGTVFRVTLEGALTTLRSFHYGSPPNHGGANPWAGLVEGTDGNFYSTTVNGGGGNPFGDDAGTVFVITPGGALTTLVSLNNINGSYPMAALVKGRDGNFYGTTSSGGATYDDLTDYGSGTIFMITPGGTLSSLFSFSGTDGARPEAGLVQGRDGNFYGTTAEGGTNYQGNIFRLVMPASPSYASWATSFGLTGLAAAADADPDGDGLPNAAEYIVRGNPEAPTTSGRPAATATNGDWLFTFARDDASETPDVTLAVEVGPDLQTWRTLLTIGASTAASSPGVTIAENGAGLDTIIVAVPREAATVKFARLKVTIAP